MADAPRTPPPVRAHVLARPADRPTFVSFGHQIGNGDILSGTVVYAPDATRIYVHLEQRPR